MTGSRNGCAESRKQRTYTAPVAKSRLPQWMTHVLWSVCWTNRRALQKRLNRSRYRLAVGARNTRMGPRNHVSHVWAIWSVGCKDRVETNERTEAIALPVALMRSVIMTWCVLADAESAFVQAGCVAGRRRESGRAPGVDEPRSVLHERRRPTSCPHRPRPHPTQVHRVGLKFSENISHDG